DGAPLAVAAEVDERIQASRAVVEHVPARNELVYGLTLRAGHGRGQRVAPAARPPSQEPVVRTPAGGTGEPLPETQGRALARAGIARYQLQPKDGLALISANGFAVGVGALTLLEAERVAALADLAGALSLEAAAANLSPFEAEVAAAKPFAGQAAVAQHMR